MDRLNHFIKCLQTVQQMNYPVHSRVHSLKSFQSPSLKCYVKRDDELGFGISGTKIRKYRTLIPYFLNHNVEEVVVIGSSHSNHVLSVVQLLIENGIKPTLFLRGHPERGKEGNALLIKLFVPLTSIHWISKNDWKEVETKASEYAQEQKHMTFVLPEGGFCSPSLPGALSLCLDILKNEQEMNLNFDHVFLEVGTGFTACALILGMHWLENKKTIHPILLAEDEKAFLNRLEQCKSMFQSLIEEKVSFPTNFIIHHPVKTKGFGKISSILFKEISRVAQTEGFLIDPIYTAKLFIETENIISQSNYKGNIMILHSGGALTLMGFQNNIL